MAVLAWFVTRILKVPLAILLCAAQYYNWDIMKTLLRLKVICYVVITLEMTLQVYWFIFVLRVALKDLCKRRETVKKIQ